MSVRRMNMVAYLTILTLVAVIAFSAFKSDSKNKGLTLGGCALAYLGGVLIPIGFTPYASSFISILGIVALGTATPMLIKGTKADKAEEDETERAQLIAIFDKCYAAGITDISTYEKRQRAIRFLDQNCGCQFAAFENRPHIFDNFFNKAKTLYMAEFDRIQKEKMDALRAEERSKQNELTKYAQLVGAEKRRKMLLDKARENRNDADTLRRYIGATVKNSQQKEKDSAILGGLVSGVAGGVAGIAAAINTEIENAQIRAQNAANLQRLSPYVSNTYDQIVNLTKEAERLEAQAESVLDKRLSDEGPEVVFEYLNIENINVNISQTGTFTVDANVSVNKPIAMIEGINGVIDGTLAATLVQNGKEVGSALMVFPMYGLATRSKCQLKGICCGQAMSETTYEVKFKPYKLWIIQG